MDVWEVPQSSCPGLDRGFLMDGGPKQAIAAGGGAPGPIGCSLPAALEAGCPLRVGRYAVPAAEESRATGHLPAASDPASSLRAVPPGAGHLRAGLEPRDLPGPTPHYRQ